jgi:hypothetical protein
MPSRRRSRNKNLGNNLADVQRRLRNMERRPVRTKLQNRVVTTAAIAVNAVGPDEVSFGTTVITDAAVNTIENPKDGLLVINETAGTTSVYSGEQGEYIQLPAVDDTARTSADGKNTIYRQNTQPTGTFAVGDTWFDSDDDNKLYRWTGTAWGPFTLGNNALASISASKITAGTIDASQITVSNLDAGNITTGSLTAARIATTALNANNITAGIISGITLKTSGTGRRIEITNEDDLIFYDSDSRVGTVTPIAENWNPEDDGTIIINDGIMIYGGPDAVSQGGQKFPSYVATDTGLSIFGSNKNYMEFDSGSVRTYGDYSLNQADIISLNSGYAPITPGDWYVEINGPLILSDDTNEGPLSEGSGQPPSSGHTFGQIVFRYT